MADWQRRLRLNPEWTQAQENEISVQELAASVASKLKSIAPFAPDPLCADPIDCERDELVERFEYLASDHLADIPSFDEIMNDLYDWGDQALESKWNGKKVCWIDTLSPPAHPHPAEKTGGVHRTSQIAEAIIGQDTPEDAAPRSLVGGVVKP